MENTRIHIDDFIHDLADIPLNDLLCDLQKHEGKIVSLPDFPNSTVEFQLEGAIKLIAKEALEYRKEADLNSVCIAHYSLGWKVDGEDLCTPLFLFPVNWTLKKQSQTFVIDTEENFEVNPFVRRMLKLWTNEEIPAHFSNVSDALLSITSVIEKNQLVAEIASDSFLGNFHYHRFHILRELEGIQRAETQSNVLNQLLGFEFNPIESWSIVDSNLCVADSDQLAVFESLVSNNIVVQGPPGTGKTQVLLNVLGKISSSNKRTLVVSEKRVALSVIKDKLEELNLGQFAFVVHSQTRSRDLLCHLKLLWNELETFNSNFKKGLRLSTQRISSLQNLLNRLNSDQLVGGISFHDYIELVNETPLNKALFRTDAPNVKSWLALKELVISLDESLSGFSCFTGFKSSFFQLEQGDNLLRELNEIGRSLQRDLHFATLNELTELYESIGRCQLVENENFKTYQKILGSSKELKKFERNRLRFTELDAQINSLSNENSVWSTIPTNTEIESFLITNSKLSKWKLRKQLQSKLRLKSVDLHIAIEKRLLFTKLEAEHLELQSYFRELGLNPTLSELGLTVNYMQNVTKESNTKLAEVVNWTVDKRRLVLSNRHSIEALYKNVHTYFNIGIEENVIEALELCSTNYSKLFPYKKALASLSNGLFELLSVSKNWKDLQAIILHSNWKKTQALFPELTKFNGTYLQEKINECIVEEDLDISNFADELRAQVLDKFKENNALLLKPSQKCSALEKEKRSQLKKGKSILVKEFAKTRSHISIRELLDSDAVVWIQDLIPIWLATPTQVADHFPLKTGLFDMVVFDEASQIPLPNAFGALFRSNRALVAGDEQQMSPTNYFGKKWSGHDLLHQAMFYFQKSGLKHHYRSAHAELINFSNRHFYNNELLVYPSPEKQQVVHSHFVPEGRFIERKNEKEAKKVAQYLENLDWSKRIGVVAFSEEQLKAILNNASATLKERLIELQESNTGFFKSLEQVQGDEAEILVISLGYAKNENEQFQMRFGPLNHVNGYKRLNVLLTRATHEIHFFHSVTSADFAISQNESVDLLRRYMFELESVQNNSEIQFPYGIQPEFITERKIRIRNISSTFKSATELLTFFRVMKRRGWEMELVY